MIHISEAELSLYAGGELEGTASARVTEHLESCAECLSKVDEFRGATAWLRNVAAEPEAGEIYRLRERVLQQRYRGGPLWWAAAAAASLAFLLVGILLFRPAPAPPNVSVATTLPPLMSIHRLVMPLTLPSRDREEAVKTARRTPNRPAPQLMLVAKNSEDMPVVRVKTSDPDVVILWVVGDGSEQEKEQ
jgi:anti-sigma factor RsiW